MREREIAAHTHTHTHTHTDRHQTVFTTLHLNKGETVAAAKRKSCCATCVCHTETHTQVGQSV